MIRSRSNAPFNNTCQCDLRVVEKIKRLKRCYLFLEHIQINQCINFNFKIEISKDRNWEFKLLISVVQYSFVHNNITFSGHSIKYKWYFS